MPSAVGGFGEIKIIIDFYIVYSFKYINEKKKREIVNDLEASEKQINRIRSLGPYLAGLIEGDGTFAIKDPDSTKPSKYNPHIIVVFKRADLELANFLCFETGCGKVRDYKDRNYVL